MALNLARDCDLRAVSALAEADATENPWAVATEFALARSASDFCDRATLLEVPCAILGEARGSAPWKIETIGSQATPRPRPAVVNLSALWAGPLCARFLGLAGAELIKVESFDRPDGFRHGDPAFYDWLNGTHGHVLVDFRSNAGRERLSALIDHADIVIEGSRPRALQALGFSPEAFVSGRAGRIWLSITGFGRSSRDSNRTAFGDDAAVAGGLVERDCQGDPMFFADAAADPLTGIMAAIAVLRSLQRGGGQSIEMSMAGVAAQFAAPPCLPNSDCSDRAW